MTEPGRVARSARTRSDGEELRFRDSAGVLHKRPWTVGPDVEGDQERLLPVREVVVGGRTLWQKRVPAELGAVAPHCYTVLEAEVRALCRLAATYPVQYPASLARLMGYDVDAAEPYVLLEPYRGEPLERVVGHLNAQERVVVQQGLLQALALTARARVVHGAVDVSALRWDSRTVQLVDFHGGTLSLQRADFGVDVAAAGEVLRKVTLGLRVNGDRRRDPQALTEMLDHVFDPDPAARPTAAELLGRLHGRELPVPAVDPEERWAASRAAFDQAVMRKRQRLGMVGPPPPERRPDGPPTGPTPAGSRPSTKVLAAVAVGVVVVVVLVLVLLLGVGA